MFELKLEMSDYSAQERRSLLLHTVVALLCIPLYMLGPTLIAYVLTPYLIWMIFSGNSLYYVPLMIHTFLGSQQRTIMLMGCFIYVCVHCTELRRYRLSPLFFLYLLGLPFFVWFTIERYAYQGFGGMFEGLGCYLTYAAFFWGVLTGGTVRKSLFTYLFWLSIIWVSEFCIGFLDPSRFYHWAIPCVLTMSFWSLLKRGETVSKGVSIFSMIAAAFALASFFRYFAHTATFTQIGVGILACTYLALYRWTPRLKILLNPIVVFAVLTYSLFSTMAKFDTNTIDFSVAYEDIEVKDYGSFIERWNRKSVGDRGWLWRATWNTIVRQFKDNPFHVTPEFQVGEVERNLKDGRHIVQTVELSAHNTFLELLRNYGLYGGGVMYLLYLMIPVFCFPKRPFTDFFNTPYAPVFALCLGEIFVGGQGGQYTILPQFSFILFGLYGFMYRGDFNDHAIFFWRMPPHQKRPTDGLSRRGGRL